MASEKQPISDLRTPAEPATKSARPQSLAYSAIPPKSAGGGIIGAIKTLLAVIPLTILIWAYAEREELDKPPGGLAVQIHLHSGSPDYLVRTVDPAARVITVNIEGSRARVERVRSQLASGGDEGIVDIAVPADLPEGKTTLLPLQQHIEDAPIFKENGIAVKSCVPASIDVRVDKLVSVDVRPGLRPEVRARISGKIVFDPPVVSLRGPRSALRDPGSLGVYADIPESDIPKSAGDHDIPPAPVRLGRLDDTITITPSTVKINIRVTESNVSYTIPNIPVFVRKPSTMEDRYRVVFPNNVASMSRITVVGPEEQIAKLRNESFTAEATLNIQTGDVRAQLPRAPTYTLPPDVKVSDEDKSRTIDFSLVDRNAP